MRIAIAQLNMVVGDVAGNADMICAAMRAARDDHGADLVVFPELAVCGYPPEDMLFQAGLRRQVGEAMEGIRSEARGIAALVGYPEYVDENIFNAAALLSSGQLVANYRKQCLPNYSVFDEERFFTAGTDAVVADIAGVRVGITICEDIWEPGPCAQARAAGAQLIVSINGSPFDFAKQAVRESVIERRCDEVGVPLVYANLVGGQDELVFLVDDRLDDLAV
ncbi:MAG: nitrilase-related carbon-nitrogen hydrolase, partial [Gammaproteobacteria bacterium]